MKPTLEQVKAYFKNAKEVRGVCGTVLDISELTMSHGAYYVNDVYAGDEGNSKKISLFDYDEQKYAEILSYKEETFTVSKEFILEGHAAACHAWKKRIEEKFPELFTKKEMEPGKWYSLNGHEDLLIYFTGRYGNNASYGFDIFGEFSSTIGAHKDDTFEEATHNEVKALFVREAERRGYKKGVTVINLLREVEDEISGDGTCFGGTQLAMGGQTIFLNGKWATIIEPAVELTVAEIEQKLGHKVKIVK